MSADVLIDAGPVRETVTVHYESLQWEYLMVSVADRYGNSIRSLHAGFVEAGKHIFEWDYTNNAGHVVADGFYSMYIVGSKRVENIRIKKAS